MFEAKHLVSLLLVSLGQHVLATDYCNPALCPTAGTHIACNNDGGFARTCSSKATLVQMTTELREFVLHRLNEYRNLVASGHFDGFKSARRMATVQWDEELAHFAELTAKQCNHRHDVCRNTKRFKHVGQTVGHIVFRVGGSHSVKSSIARTMDKWFKQHRDASISNLQKLNDLRNEFGKKIASFAQLMQERASHVGCGIIRDPSSSSNWIQQWMICNFSRRNFLNQPVYSSGTSAGAGCKNGTHSIYTNLCSLAELYDVNVVDDFGGNDVVPPIHFRFKTAPKGK